MTILSSHGKFNVFTRKSFVYSVLEGPFNEQGICNYFNYLSKLIKTQPVRNKIKVFKLVGQALFTPEAEALLSQKKAEFALFGFSEIIIIMKHAQYPNFSKEQWGKIFDDSSIQVLFK